MSSTSNKPANPMLVEAGRGSGLPRSLTGPVKLDSGAGEVESDMASRLNLADKHFKSAASRAASLKQLAKGTSKGKPVASAKSVPNRLPNGLTLRQEMFCQNVMSGMSHAAAFRDAYKCENIKPAVVYQRAYNVAINPRVIRRMEELWRQREGRLSHTPAQTRLFIQERLHLEATNMDNPATARIRALQLMGEVGRIRLFDPVDDKDNKNQDVASIMKRLQPLIDAGNTIAAQQRQAEKQAQSR